MCCDFIELKYKDCEFKDPLTISSDFEYGLIKAIKKVFPTSHVIGCFFHAMQAINRWAGINGFKT